MKTEVAVLRALLHLTRTKRSTSNADLTAYVRETEREVESALVTLARDGLVLRKGNAATLTLPGLGIAVAAAARAKEEAKTRRERPSAPIVPFAPRRHRAA